MIGSRKVNMSDTFPVQISLQLGDALLPFCFNFISEYAKRNWNLMGHISFWSILMMFIYWVKIHTINRNKNLSVVGKELSLGVIMRRVRKIAGPKSKVQKRSKKLNNGWLHDTHSSWNVTYLGDQIMEDVMNRAWDTYQWENECIVLVGRTFERQGKIQG